MLNAKFIIKSRNDYTAEDFFGAFIKELDG